METNYLHQDIPGGVPVKMWTRGVPVEDEALRQLTNAARPHLDRYAAEDVLVDVVGLHV